MAVRRHGVTQGANAHAPRISIRQSRSRARLKKDLSLGGLMTDAPHFFCLVGSMTPNGHGQRLLDKAMAAVEAAGGTCEAWPIREKRLPFFGEVWDDANVAEFKERAGAADGFIICTPEYHGTISGLLKNQLDWLSFDQFSGKPVGILSTLGGQANSNALNHLRLSLRWVHALVIQDQIALPSAKHAWTEEGEFVDEALQGRMDKMGANLVEMANRLA